MKAREVDQCPATSSISAEIEALVVELFGEEASAWLVRPAMGLNRQRPIDMLATEDGMQVVYDFLKRLEYGVYT